MHLINISYKLKNTHDCRSYIKMALKTLIIYNGIEQCTQKH